MGKNDQVAYGIGDGLHGTSYMESPPGREIRQLVPPGTEVVFLEDLTHGQRNTELDGELGKAVARFQRPPVIRLWQSANQPGISVSRKDVATASGQRAKEILEAEGWDVVVRETGGTAVPQGPGVLHISFILPRTQQQVTTDAFYRLLCWPLLDWLQTLGLTARTGELAGSYCDGTYNVLVNQRKLVGTAQAWRGGLAGLAARHPGYILAHAHLVIEYDLTAAVRCINRFYELAEATYRVLPHTSTSLTQELPNHFPPNSPVETARSVADQLADFYRSLFAIA